MIWFGSSAGVAISKDFPEARNTGRYIKEGWHVAVAYVIAFFVFLGVMGWNPHEPHREGARRDAGRGEARWSQVGRIRGRAGGRPRPPPPPTSSEAHPPPLRSAGPAPPPTPPRS